MGGDRIESAHFSCSDKKEFCDSYSDQTGFVSQTRKCDYLRIKPRNLC